MADRQREIAKLDTRRCKAKMDNTLVVR